MPKAPLDPVEFHDFYVLVKIVLVFWCLLLIPWLPYAMLAGMAFDAGYTVYAYVFVASVWTYPVAVLIAVSFWRKFPAVVLLPIPNIIGILSGFVVPTKM